MPLWVPNSARAEPLEYRYRCAVDGCGARFANRSAYQFHVATCARKNSDLLEARNARHHDSAFTDVLDKEQVSWVKQRQMEGKTTRGTFGGRRGANKDRGGQR